jgi:very-short-patch-repair endonuclease
LRGGVGFSRGWCLDKNNQANFFSLHPPPEADRLRPLLGQEGKTRLIFLIMRTFNKKNLRDKRKRLRNNPTQAEVFLWGYLKNSQLEGRKFRRQSSIKNFIVDFYCPEEKLVVELDGDFHFDEKATKDDERRSKTLETEGLKVIRFENQEVLLNLEKVLSEIKSHFKKK